MKEKKRERKRERKKEQISASILQTRLILYKRFVAYTRTGYQNNKLRIISSSIISSNPIGLSIIMVFLSLVVKRLWLSMSMSAFLITHWAGDWVQREKENINKTICFGIFFGLLR